MYKKILLIIILFAMMAIAPAGALAAVNIGDSAPDFTLKDSNNQPHSLSDYKGKYIVLEWFNPECPFVKKHYNTGNMQNLQEKFTAKDIVWLSIDSSAEGNQGYLKPEEANQYIQEKNTQSTALLLDPSGEVGRLYGGQDHAAHVYYQPTRDIGLSGCHR